MTLEEAMAKIAQLEAENIELRGHRRRRNRLPVNAHEIAPFLYTQYGSFICDREITALSNTIRYMCFPHVQRYGHGVKGKKLVEYSTPLIDMTDDQYNAYLETMTNILKEIAKCREANYHETQE